MSRPIHCRSLRRVLTVVTCGASAVAFQTIVAPAPAAAQITVFDPSNYTQNVITAARTLQQVNNQIRSLQNQATMLLNQAKNLSRIDFPQMQALSQTLAQIDQLMAQARGIGFRAAHVDQEFRRLFPGNLAQAIGLDARSLAARARLETVMAAFDHSLGVQAQIVENVASDGPVLSAIMNRSQGAEGALQAQQATNQLLALAMKQQFQLQSMLAAEARGTTIDAARRAQSEADAHAATIKFLGNGTAYPSH